MSNDGKTTFMEEAISQAPTSNTTVLEMSPAEDLPVWDKDNPPELFPKREPKCGEISLERLNEMLEMNPHIAFAHHTTNDEEIIDNTKKLLVEEKARELGHKMLKSNPSLLPSYAIKLAVEQATEEDVRSFETFLKLCERITQNTTQKDSAPINSEWEAELNAQHKDIHAYAQRLLESTYNLPEGMIGIFDVQLGTYKSLGLMNHCELWEREFDTKSYSNPVYALIRNIDSHLVADVVKNHIIALEGKDFEEQVLAMLASSSNIPGSSIEDKKSYVLALANDLPQLKGKVAPDNYKIWYLLSIMDKEQKSYRNMAPAIYSNNELAVAHQARTQEYMYSGLPQAVALDVSYREVVASMDNQQAKEKGLVNKAGRVIGTIAATPAKCKMSVEEAMYEAMGEYGDTWKANNEAAKAYRTKLAAEKRQRDFELTKLRMQLEQARQDDEAQRRMREMHEEVREQRRRANQYLQNNPVSQYDPYNRYNRQNLNNQFNGDFAPQIPIPVLMALINAVLVLLLWVIFGNTTGVVASFGGVISVVGMFLSKTERDKGILFTVAGYVLIALAVLLH